MVCLAAMDMKALKFIPGESKRLAVDTLHKDHIVDYSNSNYFVLGEQN